MIVEQVVDAPEHLQRVVDVSAGSTVSSIYQKVLLYFILTAGHKSIPFGTQILGQILNKELWSICINYQTILN